MERRSVEEIKAAVKQAKQERRTDIYFPITIDELANVLEALDAEVVE